MKYLLRYLYAIVIIIPLSIALKTYRSTHAQKPISSAHDSLKSESKKPPIKRLDADRALVGQVLVNRRTQRVEVPAEVNMTRGILEYYGVAADGKLHESVLKINAVPSHIHLALILAGYEPSEYGPRNPKTYKQAIVKQGSLLRLYIKWHPQEINREQWVPAEAWLYNREFDSPPTPAPYVFKGSVINESGYVADHMKSVIGLINDGTVILAPTIDPGNPYRGVQLGYEIFSSAIPPKGTKVTLVIQAAAKREIKEIARYQEELKELQILRRKRQLARDKLKPLPPPPNFELNLHLDARSTLTYAQESD